MKKYKTQDETTENIEEADISLCETCGCMTKSVFLIDKTHFNCSKCGVVK